MNTGNDGRTGQNDGGNPPDPLNPRVQLAQVAALLAQRRKRQSVRKLADEIGISKSALDGLVTAYNQMREMPQPHATWQKLKDWYLRQKQDESGPLHDPVDMGMLALDMLAALPDAERRAGVRKLVAALAAIHEESKIPLPAWVTRLAEAADAPPQDD